MFTHNHYVPVLKWKQGEYQALWRLENSVKDRITPLIEIAPIGYDYENQSPASSLDDHLSSFGSRLRAKWQNRRCFVDSNLIGYDSKMANGQHSIGYILGKARENQCSVVPVVRVGSPESYLTAVSAAILLDRRGVCLRLTAQDFDRAGLGTEIEELLAKLAVGKAQADLVIDLAGFGYASLFAFTTAVRAMLDTVPSLNQWRTLTLVGSSFPQAVSQIVPQGESRLIPRHEWIAYKGLLDFLGDTNRIPTFGDYAVAHPDVLSLDMRFVKPLAKLRYTVDDAWYVSTGGNVRTNGFSQYQDMCADLVAQPFFDGPGDSVGGAYIAGCTNGLEPTGNLTTWIWVSTNRHLTKVAADLATLFGP